MRLATYDREGARRLGAWVGDDLIDLPDAVGHPAFPATLEGLVTRSRGSALKVAIAALANPEHVEEAVVRTPRVLTPLILSEGSQPELVPPDGRLDWADGGMCDWQPEIACVVGRAGRKVSLADASEMIFGYLLAGSWYDEGATEATATSLGPCLVTTEEFDPCEVTMTARLNRGVWIREPLGDAAPHFAQSIVRASMEREVLPGEVFAAPPAGVGRRRLTHHATLELEAGPLGLLRTRVRFRRPRSTAS